MFDDILPKRKGFYDEMKEKMEKSAKELIKPMNDDYFDELMDMIKELTEEIEQAELDV